jgi:hypothetical protein
MKLSAQPEGKLIPPDCHGQKASSVADVLVPNFFCHFGNLTELHSNQGQVMSPAGNFTVPWSV